MKENHPHQARLHLSADCSSRRSLTGSLRVYTRAQHKAPPLFDWCAEVGERNRTDRGDLPPPLLQLNSDLQPFVKNSVGEPVSFSFSAAPVVFHRQIVGQERWHQQLQQVGDGQAMTPPQQLCSVHFWIMHQTVWSRQSCSESAHREK